MSVPVDASGAAVDQQGFMSKVLKGSGPTPDDKQVRPSLRAVIVALGLTVFAGLIALLVDAGDGFLPRVETLDAVAGLAVGAFLVDRLLTFVPPLGARLTPAKQRSADVAYLRLGYGALLGAVFVVLTDLRAVKALTPDSPQAVGSGWDRLIAVLAIAAGVAGLARLLSGLNPQPATDAAQTDEGGQPAEDVEPPAAPGAPDAANGPPARAVAQAADDAIQPAPGWEAYAVGAIGVVLAALLALSAKGDMTGLELLGTDKQSEGTVAAGGTVALVVRFGTVVLLAAIIEQLVERVVSPLVRAKQNKALVAGAVAVILGVGAARIADLFLLHNLGFFGATGKPSLNDALAASSDLERWFDTFVTGVVIAAGTKPIHDLSSRLRRTATATN